MPATDSNTARTFAAFFAELTGRAIDWVRDGEDDYRISRDDGELRINLLNLRRTAYRDRELPSVARFVDRVLDVPRSRTVDWSEASRFLLLSAECADFDFLDTIRTSVSDQVICVLTLTDAEHGLVTWVSSAMCERWGVTPEEAMATARRNQDGLLAGLTLELGQSGDEQLGMIPLDSPYKASTIFAPTLKQFVAPLGWPVFVVLPCRDFIYVMRDGCPLIGKLGNVVAREFRESAYPITTEVLRISDDGIEAIGRFSL